MTRRSGLARRRGFTAIEITMVATVIALIALIILPSFRSRLESAKLAAAYSEMDSIAKAILMVQADVGIQPRLQDLDNTNIVAAGNTNPSDQAPIAIWNGTLETTEVPTSRQRVASLWKGPYLAFKRFTFLTQDANIENRIVNVTEWLSVDEVLSNGPILITQFTGFGGTLTDTYTSGVPGREADRYPTDPWGNPYVFYGTGRRDLGRIPTLTNPPTAGDNFPYASSILYSLGPDGLVGDGVGITAINLHREANFIGTGDDLEFRF